MWKGGRGGERRNNIDTVFMYLKNRIIIKDFFICCMYRKTHSFLKDERSDSVKVNIY